MIGNNWSNAILHADADCFYASCEMIKEPTLRGLPLIIVSSIGGITLARSYEAKPFGIKTGTPCWEARKLCPGIKIRVVDFNFYANISEKINQVFREFSPVIEKYSIDESFLDLSISTNCKNISYEDIGIELRRKIKNEVGINVSVGIAPTRILAKIASDYNKPDGLKIVEPSEIEIFLKTVQIEEICGIGRNRKVKLNNFGLETAFDFYSLTHKKVYELLGKLGIELWSELHGNSVYGVNSKVALPKSIMRSRSFTTLTFSKDFLWSQIVKHCEEVSDKVCSRDLLAGGIYIFLRTKDFRHWGQKIIFPRPTLDFKTYVSNCKYLFTKTFKYGVEYRSAGVGLMNLIPKASQQLDVFQRFEVDNKSISLAGAKKILRHKYGNTIIAPAIVGEKHIEYKSLNVTKLKMV